MGRRGLSHFALSPGLGLAGIAPTVQCMTRTLPDRTSRPSAVDAFMSEVERLVALPAAEWNALDPYRDLEPLMVKLPSGQMVSCKLAS